ncbi:hypothetical protein [Streptomyces sp. YIM 121038]|uniref:hypothetical protein n=1 Tax=Streptomyces sp. YIM 121038 TaxID=2136401 RepID=UPI00148695BF|nr:hypothetical protein [Streptomyces sp. YIM 121038]
MDLKKGEVSEATEATEPEGHPGVAQAHRARPQIVEAYDFSDRARVTAAGHGTAEAKRTGADRADAAPSAVSVEGGRLGEEVGGGVVAAVGVQELAHGVQAAGGAGGVHGGVGVEE